jgi:hypothetical protein
VGAERVAREQSSWATRRSAPTTRIDHFPRRVAPNPLPFDSGSRAPFRRSSGELEQRVT